MKNNKIISRGISVFLITTLIFALIVGGTYLVVFICGSARERAVVKKIKNTTVPQWVDVQIIGENCGGRKGRELLSLKNIVIHYVGNPSTSAQANHDYFDKLETKVCSHFIVGLDGEIIQCVPLDEQSVASNWRNNDTISIEVCHPDKSGEFNDKTYDAVVKLTAWLCDAFYLDSEDVIRHYDVTGKLCPLYYALNEEEWETFKEDVRRKIDEF